MSHTFRFNVSMTCAACIPTAEMAIEAAKENLKKLNPTCTACNPVNVDAPVIACKVHAHISKSNIDLINTEVSVTVENLDTDNEYQRNKIRDKIIGEFVDLGFTCSENRKSELVSHIVKAAIGLTVGAALMALTLSGLAIPMIAMYAIVGFSALLTFALGAKSYLNAAKKLIKGRTLTMDALFAVSTLTIVGTSIASFFVPYLSMMMEGGVLIYGFQELGHALEELIKNKITAKLTLKQRAAKTVQRKNEETGEWSDCPSADIQVGDLIRVKCGDTIPIDGELELDSEDGWVDEGILHGSPTPKYVKSGKRIFAGMIVPDREADLKIWRKRKENEMLEEVSQEYLSIRVSHNVENSHIADLLKRNEAIDDEKAAQTSAEGTSKNILRFFIPAVFVVAAVMGVIAGVLFNPALAIQCATSVLVSACPCTLGFITPLSVRFGMKKAEAHGVNFKTSKAMEDASKVDIVVFDLNGTLTTGNPTVVGHTFNHGNNNMSENVFFDVVSLIESKSRHPIANAIRQYVEPKSHGKYDNNVLHDEDIDQTNHSGIKARLHDDEYLIGNHQFLVDNGVEIEEAVEIIGVEQIVYVVKNKRIVGHFKIEDPLRIDAQFAFNELRMMKKEIHLCTGADQQTALRYARKLGIPPQNVRASCRAHSVDPNAPSKTAYIKELKQNNTKRVSMIGDGSNDSNAVKESDFGIAFNATSKDNLTREPAGATIDNASLLPIVTAFAVSKQTMNSIKQNIVLSLTYNMTMILVFGGLLIGIGFALNPAIGVALMVAQMALILLNQYRIYKQEMPHIKRYQALQAERVEEESSYGLFQQSGLAPSYAKQPEKRQSHPSIDSLRSLAPSARPQALTSSPPLTLRKSRPTSSEDLLSPSERQPLLQASRESHATPALPPPNCRK
jgi:Cu2+-exporting ATPase